VNRPQTPKRPFNYVEEQVVIKNNNANVLLIAAVVLCHGSGGLDRDVTVFDHKLFMVIADYLTNNNIAVLRYDERGIRNSTGDFISAIDTDFADDAIAAIEFLKSRKETGESHLGLVGHSKGTLIYEQFRLVLKAVNVSEKNIQTSLEHLRMIFQIIKKTDNVGLVSQQ